MSQAGTVAALALRELWISFRLLIVLAAFIGAGALVALVPATPADALERLAIGFGVATIVTSALSAGSLAAERSSGRAGWLVARSVSRGTYLVGWFGALAGLASMGLAGGAMLGWMAASSVPLPLDEFIAATVAVLAAAWAAIGLGLLAGTLAAPRAAASVAVAACAAVGALALLVPAAGPLTPGGAHLALSGVAGPDPVLAAAMRAAGIGLSLAALALAAARMGMERAEL